MVKDVDDIELNVIGKGVLIDLTDNQILSCSYPLNILHQSSLKSC